MHHPSSQPHTDHGDVSPSPVMNAMSPGKAPPLARAVTMAQIAESVGVSTVAVSVVLNNSRSQVRVSQNTRQRILDTARELNYHPNELALALKRRRTNIIGSCSLQDHLLDPHYPFWVSILNGLSHGCAQHKKNLLLHGSLAHISEDDLYNQLLNGQLDGLILYSPTETPLARRLIESRLSVVTVSNELAGLPCVSVDNQNGGHLMAKYLAHKGYHRILYWLPTGIVSPSIKQRLHGFQTEAARYRLEVELFQPQSAWPFADDLKTLRARPQPPEVVVAYNDFVANAILSWCHDAGVSVPQDMAIAGFDGFPSAFGNSTNLTTIYAPWTEVAHTAVALLVQQCDGEAIPLDTRLPVELIAGQTA